MQSYPLLKISTSAGPAHASDVMSVLRFFQVIKPMISSRIIRFQVEQINNRCIYVYSEHLCRIN